MGFPGTPRNAAWERVTRERGSIFSACFRGRSVAGRAVWNHLGENSNAYSPPLARRVEEVRVELLRPLARGATGVFSFGWGRMAPADSPARFAERLVRRRRSCVP